MVRHFPIWQPILKCIKKTPVQILRCFFIVCKLLRLFYLKNCFDISSRLRDLSYAIKVRQNTHLKYMYHTTCVLLLRIDWETPCFYQNINVKEDFWKSYFILQLENVVREEDKWLL